MNEPSTAPGAAASEPHRVPAAAVLASLGSDGAGGLAQREAERRTRIDPQLLERVDRLTARLGALMDRILESGLPFSFVRIRDAKR